MSLPILHLMKIFLLAFILFGDVFCRASGLQSEIHRGRSRLARHNERTGSRHRKTRQTACLPSNGYDEDAVARNFNTSETEEKRDLSENPLSAANRSFLAHNDIQNGNSNSSMTSSPGNSTIAHLDNLSFSSNKNLSQQIDGSQYNDSISTIGQEDSNSSASNANQTQSLQYNDSISTFGQQISNISGSNANQTQELNSTTVPVSMGTLSFNLPQNGMQKNDLFLGFLPDDGSSGGTRQTMAQLNSDIGSKAAVYGWYAQVHSGVPFDGSQLLAVIDDVKSSNCVFQPAVMPIGGWQGLTSWDNSQAVNIARVLKNFTDEGIPVWLRFAHEVNYYQTDGTYQGKAADFKAGWATVADAIKNIAPSVKMWWTPNVSSAEDYEAYEPDDMSTVDLVGIDFYPKQLTGTEFLDTMKDFHDKYAVDGRKVAIGETGLGWSGSTDDKANWFNQICEAKASLPEFLSMAWFNFDKDYDYKIAGEPSLNQKFTSLIATD